MKKLIIIIALALLSVPAVFAAAGTEGREFWVALTLGRGPKDTGNNMEHYICVSSKSRSGQVTVTNPQTGWTKTYTIPTGTGWLKISDIPQQQMYPFSSNAGSQQSASGQKYSVGLRVTATTDVSVYAALRYENSFDASNILPITALQGDYITQDYPAYANETPTTSFTNFCVLATENNTQVRITPHAKTYDGKPAGVPFTVTLNAGEVYYVVSEQSTENANKSSDDSYLKSLSGSRVECINGKKIAVFNGDICTRTPNSVAARDMHYEQAIPTDYWGREFIVTRSKEKDANRIRITAMEDGTQVYLDGSSRVAYYLNAGETQEIELAVATDMSNFAKATYDGFSLSDQYIQEAMYIRTSCPVAIYNYDTGNSYKSGSNSELNGSYGDPSMTWVSPLEQNISEITFGVMNTSKTTRHFCNIVTLTSNTASVELREVAAGLLSANKLTAADWTPVPGNPLYSYARKALTLNANSIYNIKADAGFIAHVYGNGDDESYAYSCGSAAVKQGVQVGSYTLINGTRASGTFCVGQPIHMNAQVGSLTVDYAEWDMGDGVSFNDGRIEFDYAYETPGWYDLYCIVRAHKECPETTYPAETIHVAYHVVEPDTLRRNFYICEGETFSYGGVNYTEATTDTAYFNCDSVVIFNLEVGRKSSYEFNVTAQDEFVFGGQTYYNSGDYTITLTNAAGCDSVVTAHARVVTCLHMTLDETYLSACGDDDNIQIGYTVHRGDVGDAAFVFRNQQTSLISNGTAWTLPLADIKPGHYTNAYIAVQDTNCNEIVQLPISIDVLYPSSIFEQKWEDVLAVLNSKYNGGYNVIAYQWYYNDMPIPGATSSVYYVGPDDTLQPDGKYAVELTTSDGVRLLSCPKAAVIQTAAPAPAKKAVLVAPGVISINIDGQEYLVR